MGEIRSAFVDAFSVMANGLRLIARHWPVLLAIFLFGSAVRNGTLWAAVSLSKHHSTLAGFLLPFAPLATLTAIVLMLRTVSPSLAHASFTGDVAASRAATPRARTYLNLLASTLVPFLAVYAAQGYLKEDVRLFINAATYDEIFGNAAAFYGKSVNTSRAVVASGAVLIGIVVIALIVRFLLDKFDLPQRHFGWGLLAAYVEVFWLFLVARQVTDYQDKVWDWIGDRRFVDWIEHRWADVIDLVGPIGHPLQSIMHGIGNVLTDADSILIIPVAWLTVGAVALGHQIGAPERERRPSRWQPHIERVPARVRRWSGEATSGIRGRFTGLGNGIRLLIVGGLVPMMLFCLVFVVARKAGYLAAELWRFAVGPQSRDHALAFSPYFDILSTAVYSLLLVGLLGAAIDRIIKRRDERQAEATTAVTAG